MIGTTLLLSGCGGGTGSVGVDYSNNPNGGYPPGPAFDIGAMINGQPLPGFDVQPGEMQTITMSVGATFELDASASVTWNVFVNGVEVPSANNSVVVDTAMITETAINGSQFAGYVTSQGYLSAPVQLTLVATSVYDGTQSAQINFVITN